MKAWKPTHTGTVTGRVTGRVFTMELRACREGWEGPHGEKFHYQSGMGDQGCMVLELKSVKPIASKCQLVQQ